MSALTPQQLEDLQRMVALRMSVNDDEGLSWKEWASRLSGRLARIKMWTVDDTRPPFDAAITLAADAMALLHFVNQAEFVDPYSNEQTA